ncbi:TIGR00730 family Rossman fold protein [Pseudomonas chlororaphis]|uniref:LOG family protein n=1 Tax=Pseudomonas chlororaphis TaxID=587753 RepID=UPI00046FA273|nr:TIGR00730 family Rossman fold protein [Pseudomonas chlororaphis]AZC29259.1 Decarboxylase family protein [Pseudomonas chlororaphis subsp. piscium]MBP5076796.1 TIGR00730 family Rossman fold protein [Pseudomonas chlororaphis]QTT90600.1 TIGR00730 family Rossman fold protein [Pseudomonas chlororaphis]WDG80027.1 TIGR00730 family Rossman fold protein [Pseudomonas chlororaphis]WDG86920.1 TIGR00730 family Rossman fold protein [Pseudomonas chlororaphis]
MPYEPNDLLSRHFQSNGIDLSKVEEQLNLIAPNSPNIPLYRDMILTVLRMAQDDLNRWNAKITLQALRELEHAFRVLEQFKGRRKVTVFGSARTPIEHPLYGLARELGAALARSDLMVITGAGGGIMAAAHEGAGRDHSLGFNITLPFEQHANPTVDGTENLLSFHFFFTRKLFFVKEADALVLCPGGFGTLDEALEVLTLIQTGKSPLVPVVLLDVPGGTFWQGALDFIHNQLENNRYILPTDMKLMRLAHNTEEAVKEINQFYSNFHSSRWLKHQFVIRMNHKLSEPALEQMQTAFADLCLSDRFHQHAYNVEEHNEPEFSHLARLSFTFNARDNGRLRELIDFINLPENWAVNQARTPQRSREPIKVT